MSDTDSKPEIFTMGKYQFYYWSFPTHAFGDPYAFRGRSITSREVQDFIPQVVNAGCIIQDIIVTDYQGTMYLMDGKKRVLVSHALSQGAIEKYEYKPIEYTHVQAKVFIEVNPDDQAAWSIILNQARSENPIDEWFNMQKLVKSGQWDLYAKNYKLNPMKWRSLRVLEDLPSPELVLEKMHNGKITLDNVISLAKLDKVRQEPIVAQLERDEHVDAKDIKAARQAKTLDAIQRMSMPVQPTIVDVPPVEKKEFMFAVGEEVAKIWLTASELKKLHEDHPEGQGYRLVRVF